MIPSKTRAPLANSGVPAEFDEGAIEDRVIGKEDIALRHDELRAGVADPRAGLFGPDSMLWRMLEPFPVLIHMLINAGLLEGAVPKIWFGTEYSVNRFGDYESRYARSYDAFMAWFCGDVEEALKMSRKVNGYHARIGGTAPHDAGDVRAGQSYRATEQQLMIVTWATQVIPIKEFYEAIVAPLTAAEEKRYYEECARFALLFGIDPAELPPDWPAVMTWWEERLASGEFEVPRDGHDRYGPLQDHSDMRLIERWLMRWLMTVEFNLLPESLREGFERVTPLARPHPRLAAASLKLLGVALRVAPSGLVRAPRITAARLRAGARLRRMPIERLVARMLHHPYGDRRPSLNTPASSAVAPANSSALRLPAV